MRIVDLGCGTGELTRALHEKLGAVETLGIDNSASMLAEAPAATGLRFEAAAIESFEPDRPFDLVFSNAALHWVADHDALFRRLRNMIADGGQLAVQMPANEHHPSHRIAAEEAQVRYSSARIVWKASIAVTDARTMSMRKNIAESDAAVSAPAAPRITCAGVKLLIHAESADHFHVSSAAQQPATTRYDAI